MVATIGIALLFAAAIVFRASLSRGVYRRYPFELFGFVGASVVVGAVSVSRQPSWWSVLLLVVEVAAFAALIWYMSVGARFRRGKVSVAPGQKFPDFKLADSLGRTVDSTQLEGKTSLYLFYRGPW